MKEKLKLTTFVGVLISYEIVDIDNTEGSTVVTNRFAGLELIENPSLFLVSTPIAPDGFVL